jgi:hypothetical protein
MLKPFRSAFIVAFAFYAIPTLSHADTIALSITEVASGTIIGVPLGGGAVTGTTFTNEPLTFTGIFTTEQFAACDNCDQATYAINGFQGLTLLISVPGFGPYVDLDAASEILFNASSPDLSDLSSIVPLEAVDPQGHFSIPTPAYDLGPACYQSALGGEGDCPIYTVGVELDLTSVADTYTTSVVITPEVPEPSSLAMFATGLLSLPAVFSRRRKLQG